MKKVFLLAVIAAISVAVVVGALKTQAASDRYKFTARGIITTVDKNKETIKVDVNKATGGKSVDDLEGKTKEFKLDDAKFYQYNATTKKDKRVTIGALVIGQEIGFKGTARTDDTYPLTFVRIHDRSFTVVGLIKGHTEGTRIIKILFNSSTYKPSVYKQGTEISMEYPEDATFYEKTTKTPITFGTVKANDQKVKVTGTIEGANTWKIKTLIDHYKGS